MREILFRAKTEPNSKDVITGEIIKNPKWVCGYVDLGYDDVAIISSISGNRAYRCDPATVGQYTGLRDKHGKMIFEGDIVVEYDFSGEIFAMGPVEWSDPFVGWKVGGESMYSESLATYRIIGNVHDPEIVDVSEEVKSNAEV